MIIRKLKLKLTKSQESLLNNWLWNLTSVYNWAIRKIELDSKNKIYYSKFSFQGLLSGHIGMINYKGRLGGRTIIPVNSKHTTMTCSTCGSLTGPTGLSGLAVRHWRCDDCGSFHDGDINSAMVVANVGSGFDLGSGI
jgi:transposase